MEQCFGKPVLEAVLYSFALGGAVSDGNLIF
jgi:hypothetical protein